MDWTAINCKLGKSLTIDLSLLKSINCLFKLINSTFLLINSFAINWPLFASINALFLLIKSRFEPINASFLSFNSLLSGKFLFNLFNSIRLLFNSINSVFWVINALVINVGTVAKSSFCTVVLSLFSTVWSSIFPLFKTTFSLFLVVKFGWEDPSVFSRFLLEILASYCSFIVFLLATKLSKSTFSTPRTFNSFLNATSLCGTSNIIFFTIVSYWKTVFCAIFDVWASVFCGAFNVIFSWCKLTTSCLIFRNSDTKNNCEANNKTAAAATHLCHVNRRTTGAIGAAIGITLSSSCSAASQSAGWNSNGNSSPILSWKILSKSLSVIFLFSL